MRKELKKILFLLSVLCAVLIMSQALADVSDFKAGGYYKNFFTAIDPPDVKNGENYFDNSVEGIVENRLRLKFSWFPLDWFTAQFAYDLAPTVQPQSAQLFSSNTLPQPDPLTYRLVDLHKTLYPFSGAPDGSFYLGQNLDRLSVSFSAPWFDLILGRQPIAFGSAKVINPTDVLAPFTYQELDKEERTGVDAARLRIPIGEMSEIDLGTVFGKDSKPAKSAAFIKPKFYILKTDISLIGIAFQENMLAGFDLARSVGGAGFWLEAAYVFDSLLASEEPANKRNYARCSTGLDYNLADGLYGFIEYHFNGAGKQSAKNYLDLQADTAYTEGSVYLLGEHYVVPGLSYQITPLLTFNFQALTNLTDPSAFISPALEYSFTEEAVVQAGAFISLGKKASLDILDNLLTPKLALNSEFGIYPNLFFTSIRLYF